MIMKIKHFPKRCFSIMRSFLQNKDSESQCPDADNKLLAQEYFTASSRDKSARNTSYLVSVLFGISLLVLFLMIKENSPSTASAAIDGETEELQIEKAMARFVGVKSKMISRMGEIIGKFHEFSDVPQVDVDYLTKNPFQSERSADYLQQMGNLTDSGLGGGATKLELIQQANKLQLLSIMESNGKKCCMIEDKIFYVGDSVGAFLIDEIQDAFVRLKYAGNQNEKLSQKESKEIVITLRLSE